MSELTDKVTSLLLMGKWTQDRAAIERAVQAIPEPKDWTDTGIMSKLWMSRVGEQMVEAIPALIKESGMRPAHAVQQMIATGVALGIEIGRQLERQAGAR